jgi:hypothetical protein
MLLPSPVGYPRKLFPHTLSSLVLLFVGLGQVAPASACGNQLRVVQGDRQVQGAIALNSGRRNSAPKAPHNSAAQERLHQLAGTYSFTEPELRLTHEITVKPDGSADFRITGPETLIHLHANLYLTQGGKPQFFLRDYASDHQGVKFAPGAFLMSFEYYRCPGIGVNLGEIPGIAHARTLGRLESGILFKKPRS